MPYKRFSASLTAMGLVALGLAGGPAAAPDLNAELGQHIASCARESLGQRANPPSVTCIHDGMQMTFPTFGAMVQHMRALHGGG
jgi:hypothetical protein